MENIIPIGHPVTAPLPDPEQLLAGQDSARHELEQRLELAQALNETSRLILESAGEGIYGLDAKGFTTFTNPAAERMTGWKSAEMLGKSQHLAVHHSHGNGELYPREQCPIYAALHDGKTHHCDTEVFWHKDGSSFPVSYTSTPILRDGKPIGAVVIFRDISERKRLDAWEADKTAIYRSITSHKELHFVLAAICNAFVACHPADAIAFHLRTGSSLLLVACAGFPAALPAWHTGAHEAAQNSLTFKAAFHSQEVYGERSSSDALELQDSVFDRCCAIPLVCDAGEVLGTLSAWSRGVEPLSSTQQEHLRKACDMARLAIVHRKLHDELRHQSQHDALTNLPNRLLLEDRLVQAIKQARRRETLLGVCYFDLDRFKHINDTLGHAAGDVLLQHVAGLLRRHLRDFDTIARLGGDEFVMMLPELTSQAEAEHICARVLDEISQIVLLGEHPVKPSASIGIALYPTHGDTPDILLKRADIALYRAKQAGRNRVEAFNSTLEVDSRRALQIQTALPLALELNEFSLVYQPLYSAEGELVGFEALLRWQHPVFGFISPDYFIPLAEETGHIVAIGEWVLQHACQQAQVWNSSLDKPIRILVNVSGVQLGKPDFAAMITRTLAEAGLHPSLLELEVTETWYVDAVRARSQLQGFRELGIGIAIDDFGSGHASFGYLENLPADTIKIDRSLIARLDGTARGAATVYAMIALAKQLGMKVVAEGVETESQRDELLRAGCSLLQGYFFARPLSSDAACILVIEHRKSIAVAALPMLPASIPTMGVSQAV